MSANRGGDPSPRSENVLVASREQILTELERRAAHGHGVVAVIAKVEGLKSFNHAHGLSAGDALLDTIGRRLLKVVSGTERVGHLHGDAFLVLADLTPGRSMSETVEAAQVAITQPVVIGGLEIQPRITCGVAQMEPGDQDTDQLVAEAGLALLAAQEARTGVVESTSGLRRRLHAESVVDRDIRRAIMSNELHFEYQPLVALDSGLVHGAEALLRWDNPELGPVNPEFLVSRIGANGLFLEFTEWSIDAVALEWSGLLSRRPDFRGMSVSVNLSEAQLALESCPDIVSEALERHHLERDSVIVELVESGPTAIGEAAEATIRSLADAGTLIVLDDFGTGHNALEYFLRFPIDAIKFDRSLTSSMANNTTARVIVRGVSRIAAELGVATVGEGIETPADATECIKLGVGFGQGWHFGRPHRLRAFEEHASRSRAGGVVERADRESLGAHRRSGDDKDDHGPRSDDVERFQKWLGGGSVAANRDGVAPR